MARLCFFLLMSTASPSSWIFGYLRSWSILPVSFCLGLFAVMVFKWASALDGCRSVVELSLGMYVAFMTKDEVPPCVCDLEHCFLRCLISIGDKNNCEWPLIFYWKGTISIGANYGKPWFLVSKTVTCRCTGHDIASCSWVNLKVVYLCIEFCLNPKWPDIPVIFWLVETVDLHCLQMVEYCFRDFTLRRWVAECCLLIWISVLLLCPWSDCCLCSISWTFAGIDIPMSFFLSWSFSYSWYVPSCHTCSIQYPWLGSPSLGCL